LSSQIAAIPWIAPLAIALLTVAVFAPALGYGFVL